MYAASAIFDRTRRDPSLHFVEDSFFLAGIRRRKHPLYVFSYHGKRITQVSTKTWYAALEKAGIEDFRWHDLRHTWASWHVQAGTPLHVLQELGGWECVEMVRKYAHLSSAHLAEYVDRLSNFRAVEGAAATIQLRAAQEKGAA